MAIPPPARPVAPELTEERRAAAAAAQQAANVDAAKVLERHVDAWIKGQGPLFLEGLYSAPDGFVEVSIGENGRVPEAVQRELEQLYLASGWSSAKVTDFIEVEGERVKDPRGIVLCLKP